MKKRHIILLGIFIIGAMLVTGCTGDGDSAGVKNGDTVSVHYTGTLEDGTVFDSSREREPLEFILGSGPIIPGFQKAVREMQVGQVKTVTIPPEEAYGPHNEDMIMVVDRVKLPPNPNPVIGQRLEKQQEDGNTVALVITDFSDTTITLDANHPLAGKTLTFEITLLDITVPGTSTA